MSSASAPWNRFLTGTGALNASERSSALPEHGSQARREPLIIVGAGLAGCWLARLLAERGMVVTVIDACDSVGGGASGNPAGIAKPYVTRAPCPAMDFHVQAHECLMRHLQSLPGLLRTTSEDERLTRCGVLQLVNKAYSPSAHYQPVTAEQSTRLAGLAISSPALYFKDGGWLNPSSLCQSLIAHPNISLDSGTRVLGFTAGCQNAGQYSGQYSDKNSGKSSSSNTGKNASRPLWQIDLQDGRQRWTTRLVLACGAALGSFEQTRSLPLVSARGQLSRFALRAGSPVPRCIINGKHYLIPAGDTIVVGATFERDVDHSHVRAEDHALNLAGLRSMVPAVQVHDKALSGRAGVRATTPDRLPIAGPVPDMDRVDEAYADLKHGRPHEHYPALPCHPGLYLLGGLGSRGIVTAPMAAEWLADLLMKEDDDPFEQTATDDWTDLLNPARFRLRDIRRGMTDRS